MALWLLALAPTSTYPTARSQDALRTDRPIDFEKDVLPFCRNIASLVTAKRNRSQVCDWIAKTALC